MRCRHWGIGRERGKGLMYEPPVSSLTAAQALFHTGFPALPDSTTQKGNRWGYKLQILLDDELRCEHLRIKDFGSSCLRG